MNPKELRRHKRLWQLALTVQKFSGAPFRVGCVIGDERLAHVSIGYNGLPSRFDRQKFGDDSWNAVHAEVNAMLKTDFTQAGSFALATTYHPCHSCAKYILQIPKITTVIAPSVTRLEDDNLDRADRYDISLAHSLLVSAGVDVISTDDWDEQ